MKVAVIDLGTNTFHLLIADVSNGSHEIILRERTAVKIGEKGINKGEINPEAWDRALKALNKFNATIDDHKIEQVYATATSATRNARNGKELVAEIRKQTGIEVEIISGIREAELIHFGATQAVDFGDENNLIMDIGGGSIEFIIADKNKAHWMHSFEIGGQRLVENFHKSDPITEKEIGNLNNFFTQELSILYDACEKYQPKTLIGCSGTFDTLSDMHCAANGVKQDPNATELPLPLDAFDSLYKELITKTRTQRLEIPGMIEMRVEMIVVACVLINFILSSLDIENIRVSSYALKEGILFNVLKRIKEANTTK